MANLLNKKGSKTRILNTFPSKSFGKDGDIVISKILNKGVFLCTKADGMWYSANKLEELKKNDRAIIPNIKTNSISIDKLINSENIPSRILISDNNIVKYRTKEQLSNDLGVEINDIDYKTAYCSLGQYTDKNSCEEAGGTWYYSENDSHDSISSTAENQLLTVGQSIGSVDAEPTLLYDGSTLEIKRNTNYDDNWQTSAQDNLLKLTYDSNNSGYIGLDSSGNMNFKVGDDKYFTFFDAENQNRLRINTETAVLRITSPDSLTNNCSIDVDSNAATSIVTTDFGGAAGHLTLDIDGDIILDPNSGITKFYKAGDTDDLCTLTVAANGATTITTTDSDGAAGDLTLQPDGRIQFIVGDALASGIKMSCGGTNQFAEFWGEADSHSTFTMYEMGGQSTDDYFKIQVDEEAATIISTVDAGGTNGHITLDPDGDLIVSGADVKLGATKALYFDGGGDTFIKEVLADSLGMQVGGDYLLTFSEYGADGNETLFKTSCATFTRQEATFSATGVIASGGSDDTDIDFRHGNKYRLEMTADIHTMNLIFPKGSGNFVLVCTTNGDHDVSNWKVYESDESGATTSDVMWAGGSVPAFTNNGIDIVSFYWDATEQQCYGVASLAFATP